MKEVLLTKGYVAQVDDDDYERVEKFKWYVSIKKKTCYARRWAGEKPCALHRFILNAPDGLFVDHIDGNGLNCQKSNLRLASCSQNAYNRHGPTKGSENKSGYKGVYIVHFVRKTRWRASIGASRTHLGYFDTAEDAARAYDTAAKEMYGEFARTNL